jgi:biopolymer transport protein ExbD
MNTTNQTYPYTHAKPNINVTPLIDVLLVLLIIFMVVSPLKPARFLTKVPSPPDRDVDLKPNDKTLVVTIKTDRTLMLNSLADMGSVNDTSKLSATLSDLFQKRLLNHVYRDELHQSTAVDSLPGSVEGAGRNQRRGRRSGGFADRRPGLNSTKLITRWRRINALLLRRQVRSLGFIVVSAEPAEACVLLCGLRAVRTSFQRGQAGHDYQRDYQSHRMYGEPKPMRGPVLAFGNGYSEDNQSDVNRRDHCEDHDAYYQSNYIFITHLGNSFFRARVLSSSLV